MSLLGKLLNQSPVPLSRTSGSPWSSTLRRDDPVQQMAAMGAVGTLFAIVNRTSTATSQVHWHLWNRRPGSDGKRTEVVSHAALDLWSKPNEYMPGQNFVETFQQHLDLTGEAWWVVSRNKISPMPLELWPIRPDRIEPISDPTRFLSHYVYTSPDGQKIRLEKDEVIGLQMPNPLDLYRGMGPVQALLADLDAVRYSAQWNRNFFLNSAEPGGIIEVEDGLSDDQFEQMTARWNEQHRGVANAHRVAVIERGKWVSRSFSMRDMQFTELRTVSRDVILEAYGMAKATLGVTEDVNRAAAVAAEYQFARWLLVPRLERIKAALNNVLLPLYGTSAVGLEFDYDSPVPDDAEDTQTRAQAASTLVAAGYDPADALVAAGLEPMRFVGLNTAQELL